MRLRLSGSFSATAISTPTRGAGFDCCARAPTGQPAAAPRSVKNSRRLMHTPRVPSPKRSAAAHPAGAVGTRVSSRAPRTEPYVRLSRIRLVWGFPCQGCITPHFVVLLLHSFVRPAPRAFFRPRRHITIAVAHSDGQGRRFFTLFQRRRRLVLDQREHGGRLP